MTIYGKGCISNYRNCSLCYVWYSVLYRMLTIQLNAEIYEALSIIAKDESLLRKAAKALKKLASQKSDETLMTENDFFVRIDEAKKQIKSGKCKKMLQNENLDDFLARNGYV